MKMMKRALALLLCVIMVVGLVPATVFAASNPATGDFSGGTSVVEDAFVAFADLHIGTNSTNKQALLTNVLSKIKASGVPVSSVASSGDMYSSNESTMSGNASTVTGWVQSVFGASIPVNYVWTDHDRGTTDISKESRLVYSGNYYIYLLSMADLSSWDRYNAGFYSADQIAQHIEAFKTTVAGLDKTKPLFIVGHQPLFNDRGDNGYAYDWVTAINEVGAKMDVVYFYGHNHNYDDNKDCYYYAKGSTMTVPTTKVLSGSGYNTKLETKNVELKFTHINAGYMDPGSNYTTNARLGTALLVTIYNDKINFTTYDQNGVDKTSYAPINKDASRDHVKIPKSLAVTGKTDYQIGDSITDPTVKVTYTNAQEETLTTGCTLTKITKVGAARANEEYPVEGFTFQEAGNYELTYTANVGSYQAQATLAVTAAAEGETPSNPGTEEPVAPNFQNVTIPGSQTTTQSVKEITVYKLVTTPVAGRSYLIVNSNNGNGYGLDNNTGGYNTEAFTVGSNHYATWDEETNTGTSVESGVYLTTNASDAYLWKVASGLTFTHENVRLGTSGNNNRNQTLAFNTSKNWTYNSTNHRLQTTASTYTYTLICSNNGTWSVNRNSTDEVYFYELVTIYQVDEETVTIPSVEYSMRAEGITLVYTDANKTGKIDFCLQADGTDAATLPAGGSYSFTALNENNICSIDSQGNVTFNGTLGETTIRVAYTWTQDGETYQVYRDVVVEAKAPYFGIELHKVGLQEATGVTAENFANGKYYIYNETTGFYVQATEFAEGTTYYIAQFTQGDEIKAPVALKGIKGGEIFAIWAVVKEYDGVMENGEDGRDLGDLPDDALTWEVSDTGIATIDPASGVLTFTGENYGTFRVKVSYTGSDGQTVTDEIKISASESLYVVPGDGTNDFPDFPNPGAVRFDKTATAVGTFSQTGMAQVELSMTGVPMEKGIDVIVMLDTSSSMTRCVYCAKKQNEHSNSSCSNGAYRSRLAELNDALDNMIETFGAKNPDGTFKHDIRIAIRDFNGAVSGATGRDTADRTQDADGLSGAANLTEFTGSGLGVGAFVDFDENYDELMDITVTTTASGTNYDYAFDAVYQMGQAIKEANGENERDLYVIFMSDGSPNYYNYYGSQGGNTATSGSDDWNYWLTGAIGKSVTVVNSDGTSKTFDGTNYELNDIVQNSSHYHYFYEETGNQHRMANAVKGDPLKRYEIIRKATGLNGMEATGETNMYTIPGLGATMYSVAFTPANDGRIQKESMIHVLRNVATSVEKHYFEAADAGALKTAFSDIATNILEAATDVRVEDKIGKGYVVNFGLPTANFDKLPSAEMGGIDGEGSTEFYMQVLNYKLDPVTNERTGTPTVLEKFTFNLDGTLKSHTVAGQACGDTCNHVTTAGGKITKISGTYFQFEDKGNDGQIMTWTADRLTRDELVLQYFVYLEGSADSEIPAGTYYTNEYAKLTYTNFQGVKVENTFPVPQLTWNGAQVRYTFYLVNEQGQPVNRQGYVVPFADAVYVTDIFVESMTWNEVQHYESFDAALKAENLLPSVYELYDPGASYNVHVFESEYGSDLNNHFHIGSSFTQDQVTAGEKAWTTFVFNNKSDALKYSIPGYYAMQNPFGCTSTGTVTLNAEGKPISYTKAAGEGDQMVLTYDGAWELTTEQQEALKKENIAAFNNWVLIRAADHVVKNGNNYHLYFQDQDGTWYTIVQRSNATEVNPRFDYGNTAVAFAVVWTPGLKEDTVVVDFGLDVVIDVITNDVMIPGVVGLNTTQDGKTLNNQPYQYGDGNEQAWSDKPIDLKIGDTVVGKAWIVEGDTAHVRVSLDRTNGMQLTEPISFYYEAHVQYYDQNDLENSYMYSKVTIIPAATMYYEDEYVKLTTFTQVTTYSEAQDVNADDFATGTYYTKDGDNYVKAEAFADGTTYYVATTGYKSDKGWPVDSKPATGTQDVDRPGADKIGSAYDADNNFGYDSAYKSMSTHSMGNAAMVNVYSGRYATAEFAFFGTGFDVISVTSNATGVIAVQVWDADNTLVRSTLVNTYYGMNTDGTLSENNPEALYQVPVIKIAGLDYGRYTVKITATYNSYMDKTTEDGYDLYLDAIRIYDPVNPNNATVGGIYEQDGEGWPEYTELRNQIIQANQFADGDVYMKADIQKFAEGVTYYTYNETDKVYEALATDAEFTEGTTYYVKETVSGVVFIDGIGNTSNVADYTNYGPNNELYLAKDQAIAFMLNATAPGGKTVASIQLGIKSVGGTGHVTIIGGTKKETYNDEAKTYLDMDVTTATDMYYDISDLDGKYVVIQSIGDAMISLTNIKVTYKTATGGSGEGNAAPVALRMFFANEEAQQLEAEQNSYLLSVDANTIAFAFSVLNPKEEVKDEPVVEPEVPTESEIPEEPTEPEAPVEPERFTPKKLKVELSKNKITQGDKVIVNVKTESDVAYIVVNGEKVTKYQANRFSKQRTWTVILTAEEAGEMKVAVVAYDKADVASEPVSKTVKVERKIFKPQKLEVKVNDKKVQEGDKAKVTVTTSKDVAYIVVNGEKIMKFQTDRHNKQRTWTVELTAEEAGDMRVEVIAYNLDGVASEAEAETVTVQAKKSHKNHAWNEMMNLWGKYFD